MRRKRAVESIGGNIKTLHLRDIQEGGSENAFVGGGGGFKKEWSPAEANVFASSFVDATVAVWDVRVGKSHALAFKAQKDVNVISWNRFFCQKLSNVFWLIYRLCRIWNLSLEKDEEEKQSSKHIPSNN
ncbi:unnamed protein product [Brassica rapa]|uniref:Peroxin-7 n=1 Tax=Brassica campestris TaxID=3711 RepID=A0A8D9D5Y8_BRACM|nr:unnamed protein product [Brassica rapa]